MEFLNAKNFYLRAILSVFATGLNVQALTAQKATSKRVEFREDEERAIKLQDSIDLLLAAGYFRARIKAIPPFDRIIGGMVWCLTLCNRTVDIDLIYSESSSIKQKIALTEKVVEVLTRLKCPYTIEPHQIQGLDFVNIYPVIQWLVKKALETKELQENSLKNHALFYFQNCCQLQQEKKNRDETVKLNEGFAKIKSLIYPYRIYRRPKGFACDKLHEDTKKSPIQQFPKELELGTSKQNVSTHALGKLIDIISLHETAEDVEKVLKMQLKETKDSDKKVSDAKDQLQALKLEEGTLDQTLFAIKRSNAQLSKEIEQYRKQTAIFYGKNKELDEKYLKFLELRNVFVSEVEKCKKLLEAYDEIKSREARFKNDCKQELRKMDEELQNIEMELNKIEEVTVEQQTQEYKEVKDELSLIRNKDAVLTREIINVQRQIDLVPSQIEISQYQRRIIELYNQMAVRNRVIKQLYNYYNSLSTIILYKQKELDLMNSIDEIQEQAMKESYKQSFLENLLKFERNVEILYDKINMQEKEKELVKEKIRDDYQGFLEKERRYHKLADDFQEECQKNEAYSIKLEASSVITDS
uniref:Coiled-coil domain-containing protein 93 n=1 Tax=Syphacia muris TaxID=451379 RepID=A0A0N5AKH9_9BILA